MVDDFVDHRKVCNKADDLHCATALRAEEGVNLLDFTDHLGPALGGDGPELVLSHPQGQGPKARLLDFPPVGVGVETVITDGDLALVGDMRGYPGNELQVVHPQVYMAAMTPGVSALPVTTSKYRVNERRAKRQSYPSSRPL